MPGSPPLTFAQFVAVPENRPALLAVRQVVDCLVARRSRRTANPLYLHGPPGTGKTHLVSALIEEATRRVPDLVAGYLTASELGRPASPSEEGGEAPAHPDVRQVDLFIVEDLQFLSGRAAEAFRQRLDELRSRRVALVFTASVGPCELALPARLCSRLASGLVIRLEPFAKSSRLAVLKDKAQRRQLAVSREVLAWLAEHLTGGRSLDGALAKLEVLSRSQSQPLELAAVQRHFEEQAEAGRPTMERIVQRVGGHFRVEPGQLRSSRRGRGVLLPRQVSMYLARQLSGLSLGQIGAYFGGRDHSTVLHACRKMEQALSRDPVLAGTIRRLRSDLA